MAQYIERIKQARYEQKIKFTLFILLKHIKKISINRITRNDALTYANNLRLYFNFKSALVIQRLLIGIKNRSKIRL